MNKLLVISLIVFFATLFFVFLTNTKSDTGKDELFEVLCAHYQGVQENNTCAGVPDSSLPVFKQAGFVYKKGTNTNKGGAK
jgi:hypothetical protein